MATALVMSNGYTLGPPDYTPYHPPTNLCEPPDLSGASGSASGSGGGGSETRRPRLAPPAPGSFPHHPGMSGPNFGPGGAALPPGLGVPLSSSAGLSVGLGLGGETEEDANRSRNARAQRRHREKRKAHVKNLEDSVVALNSQLDDARRQLAHYHASGGDSRSLPDMSELHHLRNENMMLRDENMELRRQLGFRGGGGGCNNLQYPNGSGHMAPPPPVDEKPDGIYGRPEESPRIPYPDRDGGHGEPGSNTSASSGFAPPLESMTPMSRSSRDSRVMSISSGPGASPYIPSSGTFASDPRHHSFSSSSGNSTRFDNIYAPPPPAPPPGRCLARSESGAFAADDGFNRDGSGSGSAPWDNVGGGPPPFPSSTPSFISYSGSSGTPHQGQAPAQKSHDEY